MFITLCAILSDLGEHEEADALLNQYELTVPERDSRYIRYCGMRCQSFWARGEYSEAVRWGELGSRLQESSSVDTNNDVRAQLALALRDAGEPESALPIFLKGRTLPEIVDPDELDESLGQLGGAYYGNIGRCLHFMGNIDDALVCYQKSALLIEKEPTRENVMDQGFVRLWIGELLVAKGEFGLADVFLRGAQSKWKHAAPPRAARARLLLQEIAPRLPSRLVTSPVADREVEPLCLNWIMGRSVEARFR